jgi:hypothetical protein
MRVLGGEFDVMEERARRSDRILLRAAGSLPGQNVVTTMVT